MGDVMMGVWYKVVEIKVVAKFETLSPETISSAHISTL